MGDANSHLPPPYSHLENKEEKKMGIGRGLVEGIRRVWRNPVGRAMTLTGVTVLSGMGVGACRKVTDNDTRAQVRVYPDSWQVETYNVQGQHLQDWKSVAGYFNARICGIEGLPDEFINQQAEALRAANKGATPIEAVGHELDGAQRFTGYPIGTTINLTSIQCPPCVQTGAAQQAAGTQTSPTALTIPDFYTVPDPFTMETVAGLAVQAGKSLAQPLAIDLPEGVRLDTSGDNNDKVHLWMELLPTGTGTNLDCTDSIEVAAHASGGQLVIDSLQVPRQIFPPVAPGTVAENKTVEVRVAAFIGRKLEQGQTLPEGTVAEIPIDLVLQLSVSPAVAGSGGGHTGGHEGGTPPTTGPINIQTPDNPFGIR